jgi:dynactin complex subunit
MTSALALQILAAIGGLAGVSSFINLLISRKKVRVEAADIAQNTSDKVIKNLNNDNDKLRKQLEENNDSMVEVRDDNQRLRERMETYEWELSETRLLAIRLLNWSRKAYEELHLYGSEIEAPPKSEKLKRPE